MEDPHNTAASCLAKREMAAATLLGVREGVLLFGKGKEDNGENPNLEESNSTNTATATRGTVQVMKVNGNGAGAAVTFAPNSFVSMSSIGFGVSHDATEACQRAIDDAMARTSLQLSGQPQLHVKLGVPTTVDTPKLQLPPVATLTVVPGGLLIEPSIAVVACLTLQQGPWSMEQGCETKDVPVVATLPAAEDATETQAFLSNSSVRGERQASHPPPPPPPQPPLPPPSVIFASAPTALAETPPPTSNSMEVLAMISEEIANASAQRHGTFSTSTILAAAPPPPIYPQAPHVSTSDASSDDPRNNYNYQKLPPGLTMKNNRRLFVKHTYKDYSGEVPTPDEESLLSNTVTPNAAFPLKLHEILTQIELAGLSDIIGWLPHGRSFKIHHQQEFAALILPKYFVMTKKSSFLRQLNLYGFNRLCGGPDQGSYYHEKFLRGLKFLCKRMNRQKVNGNRIRSAGNPDEEPVLSSYPTCPPKQTTESI